MQSGSARDPSQLSRQYKPSNQEDQEEEVDEPSSEAIRWARARATAEKLGEHPLFALVMTVLTFWALYQADIRLSGTDKEADTGFEAIISIVFFIFLFEIGLQCFYKADYLALPQWKAEADESWYDTWYRRTQIGSFYFWLDLIAAISLIFEMEWMLGSDSYDQIFGAGVRSAKAGQASSTGAQASRIVRLLRMVRLVRMMKLYRYATSTMEFRRRKALRDAQKEEGKSEQEMEEEPPAESKVGAAMSDLTSRRVLILILLMLIIIPLLTVDDPDISNSLAVQMVHQLAVLNASDPATYQDGLNLALKVVHDHLDVVVIRFNDVYNYNDRDRFDALRPVERIEYELSGDHMYTYMAFDSKHNSVQGALFSIYTTSFIIVLLMSGIYFFSSDVKKLVIGPIERLVELVRKISANPLGVEYKMLGAKEGFLDGMETTILLTTITKIGGLMRVGFGEAGASIIAKNLADSSGGKLNLMGSGTMIHSIFGFCDVRQFTDTTECLQEEVMLFVNRIAHILHSIVVQCSGAANKNIGDAFLLTWKIDDKFSPDQVAALADQALLTFVKAFIELSRYSEFICNFSIAATARLYKRFPEYAVRIGSGLHVGWAIEGAIGSNRKIDASYLSPHVNASEFLESSTKSYGVSLLMSEPFFQLLSPSASKYCRQVDRIRRSMLEEPMGLYTYDADMTINWNDPYRNQKKDPKSRLLAAAKKLTNMTTEQMASIGIETSHLQPTTQRKKSHQLPGIMQVISQHHNHHNYQLGHHFRQSIRRTSAFHSHNAGMRSQMSHLPTTAEDSEPMTAERKEAEEMAAMEEARKNKAKQTPTVTVPPYTQQVWTEDSDVVELRHKVDDKFRQLWEEGIIAYIKGDWSKAESVFVATNRLAKGKDGPSKFLLDIIKEHGGKAPDDWQGYRMEGGGH